MNFNIYNFIKDIKSTLDGTSYDSPSQDPFESVNGSLNITLKSGQLLNARVANMYVYTVEVKQQDQTSTFDSADIQIPIGRVRDLTLTPNFNKLLEFLLFIPPIATIGKPVLLLVHFINFFCAFFAFGLSLDLKKDPKAK